MVDKIEAHLNLLLDSIRYEIDLTDLSKQDTSNLESMHDIAHVSLVLLRNHRQQQFAKMEASQGFETTE